MLILLHMVKILWDHNPNHTLLIKGGGRFLPFFLILLDHLPKQIELISSPKASNGQQFPCPALLSPWFSWGRQGSSPDRGRSPVEWGDFTYVNTYKCLSVHSPLWAIQLGLRPSQPELKPEAWLSEPQA